MGFKENEFVQQPVENEHAMDDDDGVPDILCILREKLDAGRITAEEYSHLREVHLQAAQDSERDKWEFSPADLSSLSESDRVTVMEQVKSGRMDVHNAISQVKRGGSFKGKRGNETASQQRLKASGSSVRIAPVIRETQVAFFRVPPPPPPSDNSVDIAFRRHTKGATASESWARPDGFCEPDLGRDTSELDEDVYDNVACGSSMLLLEPTHRQAPTGPPPTGPPASNAPPIRPPPTGPPLIAPLRTTLPDAEHIKPSNTSNTRQQPPQRDRNDKKAETSCKPSPIPAAHQEMSRISPVTPIRSKREPRKDPTGGRKKRVLPTIPNASSPRRGGKQGASSSKHTLETPACELDVNICATAALQDPAPVVSSYKSSSSVPETAPTDNVTTSCTPSDPTIEITSLSADIFKLKSPSREPPPIPVKRSVHDMSGAAIRQKLLEGDSDGGAGISSRKSVTEATGVYGPSLVLALESQTHSPTGGDGTLSCHDSEDCSSDDLEAISLPKNSVGISRRGIKNGKTRYSIKQREKRKAAVLERMLVYADDISEWLNSLLALQPMLSKDTLLSALEDGILLCRITEEVHRSIDGWRYPTQIPPHSLSPPKCSRRACPGSFQARDNVANFIKWVTQLGCPCLFETEDLVLHKNDMAVLYCLMDVARGGAKCLTVLPQLIVFEREIDEGDSIIVPTESQSTMDMQTLVTERLEAEANAARRAVDEERRFAEENEAARLAAAEAERQAAQEMDVIRAQLAAAEAIVAEHKSQSEAEAAAALAREEALRLAAEESERLVREESERLAAQAQAVMDAEKLAREHAVRLEKEAMDRIAAMEAEIVEAKKAAEIAAREAAQREAQEKSERMAAEEQRRLRHEADLAETRRLAQEELRQQRERLEAELATAKAEEQAQLMAEAARLEKLRKEQEQEAAIAEQTRMENLRLEQEQARKEEEERRRVLDDENARIKAAWEEIQKQKEAEEARLREKSERIEALRKQQEIEAAERAAQELARREAIKKVREAKERRAAALKDKQLAIQRREEEERQQRLEQERKLQKYNEQLEAAKQRRIDAQRRAEMEENAKIERQRAAEEAQTRVDEANEAMRRAQLDDFWMQEALKMEQESAKKRKTKVSTSMSSSKAGHGTVIPKHMAEKLEDLGMQSQGHGRYLLGKQQVHVRLYKKHLVVRVGGGWDTLENYLMNHFKTREGLRGHVLVADESGVPKWQKAPEMSDYVRELDKSKAEVAQRIAESLRGGTHTEEDIQREEEEQISANIEFENSKTLNKIAGFAKRPSRSPAKKMK